MLVRIFAALMGVFNLGNGLFAAALPRQWFFDAPGAADTGPFNPHFVTDVGLGFVATGIAFLAFAWRPRYRLAALGASGFVVFHAMFHLSSLLSGHHDYAAVDLQIALLAFAGLALCWPWQQASGEAPA